MGLVLIGGGGHCRACIDVIEAHGGHRILGILDLPERVGDQLDGHPFIGTDEDIAALAAEGHSFLVTVGQIESSKTRERLLRVLERASADIATIVSPSAYVAHNAEVGRGTIVMHRALVNAGARVGVNCILNTMCLVEHDASVGNHCHVSTGAVVNGTCHVGNRVFIGSNSVIRNNVSICDDVVVGAGSVVVRDIAVPGIWLGNPSTRRS